MALNRRQFLWGSLAAATATAGLSACGGRSGGEGGPASLALAWWGNPTRNANTTAAIDLYLQSHEGTSITAQPGEWASYWDRLATQTAGGSAPDVIQMDMAYLGEYGARGALLDLSQYDIDTSSFAEGTADSGEIDGAVYGINAGINTPVLMANPALFEQAGLPMPDDTTWTWDDLRTISAEVAAGAGIPFGVVGVWASEDYLELWLRQQGKSLFSEDGGLGFEAADAAEWLEMALSFQEAGATGSPSQIGEEAAKSLDQSAIAVGTGAMQTFWSNQLEALSEAAGTELTLLRYPSSTGSATDRATYYKASMLWSASARTEDPEAAAALIDWWVNSPEAAGINLAERGIPANTEVRDAITPELSEVQQRVVQFIADIEPETTDAPSAPPAGGGALEAIFLRAYTDVLFGSSTPSDAAQAFVDEASSNLSG
ncbi:ABC transporter substrate-binding protein [uncultured Pseudokineococcus sp.]|uniref:ABC transporter substrate-binding protein n=1 Tax=uncultured Pseudokineococcus sp. TaxID=1642928 RepID=UPI00261A2DE4|nr:extracellular solute-binding protein [uncultured Pseudokineococcus sp.]